MSTQLLELLNGVSAWENRIRSNANFQTLLNLINEHGFVWNGDYNDAFEYIKGDVVKYNSWLYIAKTPTIGLIPTNTSAWDLLIEAFQGEQGLVWPQWVSVTSIARTSGTGAPGTTDIYTINFSNSTSTTFTVYNGANGTGDMSKSENLSGLSSYSTARANMWVYSSAEVDWLTHAATTKSTPVDADELSLWDSAASWWLKKFTWSNMKTVLKTYFDTLYQTVWSYVDLSWTQVITWDKTISWPFGFRYSSSGDTNIVIEKNEDTTWWSKTRLFFKRTRGTFATPLATAVNDVISSIAWQWHNWTVYKDLGGIEVRDNWTRGKLIFSLFDIDLGNSIFSENVTVQGNAKYLNVAPATGNEYCRVTSNRFLTSNAAWTKVLEIWWWAYTANDLKLWIGVPTGAWLYLKWDTIEFNWVEASQFVKNTFATINSQTGTTYTFVLTDAWSMVTFNNAAAQTVTVPPNSSVAFPIGTQIDCSQLGAGKVTFAQWAGVTIQSKAWNKAISAQYVGATLKKIGTDTWLLLGDLIA